MVSFLSEAIVEIVIEQDEIEEILRQALQARGIQVPLEAAMRIRKNNKKGTIRIVFMDKPGKCSH